MRFTPKKLPDDLRELENTPWAKFCKDSAESEYCEFCTNEEHADTINGLFKGVRIYCDLDCEHRTKNFDGVPLNVGDTLTISHKEHDDYAKSFIALKNECTGQSIKAVIKKLTKGGLINK